MDDSSLIRFIEQVSGEVHLRVEENLGDGFVRLRTAEAERRQAKHDIRHVEDIIIELLRNARDACATRVFISTFKEGDERRLTVIDDGSGIPLAMQALIFEPRVTSKLDDMVMDDWGVHGRGMALYSIKSNTLEARVCDSSPGAGSALTVLINTSELPERSDQSTLPTLERNDDGLPYISRGPHNIIRNTIEFALIHRSRGRQQGITVYLGSPSEIVATLIDYGQFKLGRERLLFCSDLNTLPLCERLAASADAAELVEASRNLGLDISERTAHRIISGQISPLKPMLDVVMPRRVTREQGAIDLTKDTRGLKLAREDVDDFSRALERAFEPLAKRYYLSLSEMPKVSVKGETITVRFPFEKEL
ncbi:MAG: ATP-binding protein [Coriobacteriia bacterium]|nr:ATP-binding protein [Coriobacteriia bacterium]